MEGVFGAPFVDVLRTCPVLAVTGVVCVLIGVLEGVVVSVGVGSTVGASEHSRALCLLVAGSECVLFILLGACNIVVGYVKALPTLLSRRSKPISSKLFGCCTLFCVVGITLASVDVSSSSRVQRGFCGEFSRTTLVFATSLIVISAFDLAMFLVIYLVDLEIHKPMDWDYDSIILHYARCLCWSSRKRRFVFGALPFYLLTLLSLILTLSYWNNGSGEPVCVYERRTYLMVASSLFLYLCRLSYVWHVFFVIYWTAEAGILLLRETIYPGFVSIYGCDQYWLGYNWWRFVVFVHDTMHY
mmetsp:Transcript_24347/g.52781  ORF Transcript_24347/g.52781 Transcript_24347/m.52781 type:complete len:300 (-) Transcript_24347:849-1748(-)